MVEHGTGQGATSGQVTPEAVIALLAKEANLDPAMLRPEETIESLGIGSLDLVSALFAIEDHFGIDVSPDEAAEAVTLGDFLRIVMAKAPHPPATAPAGAPEA